MKLIDKAALVAEIEKRKNKNREICTAEGSGAYYEDGFILDIINSLQAKEVNLEKEIDNYLNSMEVWQIQEAPFTSMENIAKYFYELGFKQRLEE